ncbi:glycosyltransferase [Alkalihalobacterium elongatum]|uniref:glycosyltransferase n=1 Tax=Alkalihalobacterium elongatum TaxID=2675466 RepID=UPI001C1F3E69|nr:glycosyltransferase [Alkalihalobacterium elongatum]
MKALFVHSHIFKYDSNNIFYSGGQFPYKIFESRYLKFFDEVIVASRVEKNEDIKTLNVSSGPRVQFVALPNLSTIKNRKRNTNYMEKILEENIKNVDVVVARMPSEHAYHAIKIATTMQKPVVVEVVGDVLTSLWTHGSVVAKLLAPIYYIKYKNVIKRATNLIYVTERTLQRRYPYNPTAITINASNVEIPVVPESILKSRKKKIKDINKGKKITIGLIGSYSSKYKGIDTAIKSLRILNDLGWDCNLYILGEGNNKWLVDLSEKLHVQDRVFYEGVLPGGEKVFEWLDQLDIYIQPSLTEGLPRALIEAMSRGLPCVASSVGGIPELINNDLTHKPKSEKELAEKIDYLLNNQVMMLDEANRNYLYSKNFTTDVLNNRRKLFWESFFEREIIESK